MKITSFSVAVLLLAALVVAEDAVKFAGTTEGSPSWTVPNIAADGSCTPGVSSPYVVFNVTWTTGGVREVVAMAENKFKSYIEIYVYANTFDVAAPCTGVTQLYASGAVPPVDDWLYFTAGVVYIFVISSGPDSAASGILAVNIFPGVTYGSTTETSPAWPIIVGSTDGTCTTYGTPGLPDYNWGQYSTFTWTQASSGWFDISVLFSNSSFPPTLSWGYTYLALFTGSFLAPDNLSDPCNVSTTGAVFSNSTEGSGLRTILYYVWLTAGTNYSIVFSGDNSDDIGNYAVQVGETRVRFPKNSPAFGQPERDTTQPIQCTPDTSSTAAAWDAVVFTAEERVYVFDQGTVPYFDGFDSFSFLYAGINNGTVNPDTAPTTCPLTAPLVFFGDTGDVTPIVYFTTINTTYTVVVSTFGGGTVADGSAYVLYAFTGKPIGTLPSSSTSSTGGGQATGGQATGGGSTTKSATTGSGLTTGKITSTTGNTNRTTTSTATTTGVTLVPLALLASFVVLAM